MRHDLLIQKEVGEPFSMMVLRSQVVRVAAAQIAKLVSPTRGRLPDETAASVIMFAAATGHGGGV